MANINYFKLKFPDSSVSEMQNKRKIGGGGRVDYLAFSVKFPIILNSKVEFVCSI